jgi:membrane associated rhomboid family serine protease
VSQEAKPTRTLWFALVIWAGASVAALTLAGSGSSMWLALAVGAAGGLVFGWLSARRVDGRRVRRRRHHRPGSAAAPGPAPTE